MWLHLNYQNDLHTDIPIPIPFYYKAESIELK